MLVGMGEREDRVMLVTGATDGIGKQTALELLRKGAQVIVHGRTEAKVAATVEALRAAVPGAQVSGVTFDLASLAAVRAGAARVLAHHPQLHVLVNNAGVFLHQRQLTVDGHETTFAVNHLAPFLLTELLRERLVASGPARVVNVSSGTHTSGQIDLKDLMQDRRYSGFAAYSASKLANVLHANALAARHDPAQLTANSLHPGVIGTKLLTAGWGAGGGSLENGARTSVKLATDPGLAGVTGRYFSDAREAKAAPAAHDATLREGLWNASAKLVGLA
jgi:retinol dehydrogenase-12